jgi:hypothetical protein
VNQALADWTASGTFQYMDRDFDDTGFTGVESPKPVRAVDLEVVDANATGKGAILATGVTDYQGNFSILVSDSSVRDVYVRAITRSDETIDLNIDVRDADSGKPYYYAAATETFTGHDPSVDVDFGTAVIQIGQGGESFNVFDQMLTGVDYIASLGGSRPGSDKHLATVWGPTNGVGGSYYDTGATMIILRDTAGYDDTVVLHEMGHFAVREYSRSDAFGGAHTFSMCWLDIRLSFEEGFASYWGNSALRHSGRPRCNIYTRTNGGPGPGNLVRYADLETDTQYLCQGGTSEVNVFAILWDVVDGPSTPDTTPGVDDPHDLLDLEDIEVWEVMTDQMPGASNTSLEDFWDGWFLPPVLNGFRTELIDIADQVSVEYFEDANEENNSPATAAVLAVTSVPTHASLFYDPELDGAGTSDNDYFSFFAEANETYIAETLNLTSDGNTYLRLYDTDGQLLLAYNNDRASGDDSSLIEWTAPRSDLFYLRISHAADVGVYGSYDVRVMPLIIIDNDIDGYDEFEDCNDNNPGINPGAMEICDGVDQDCDGQVDNGYDVDDDGYTSCAGDCDDGDPAVHPGMEELVGNGIDDNCNGRIDETGRGHPRDFRDFVLRPALN